MATKQIVVTTNSVTGDVMPDDQVHTATLALNGVEFTLHLTEDQRGELVDQIHQWTHNEQPNRHTNGHTRPKKTAGPSATAGAREWLRDNGHQIGDRGRIPTNLIELWDNAGRPGAA